jgi:hypothetical protein
MTMQLPLIEYGTDGLHGFFAIQLKEIAAYPDLQPELLQSMREVRVCLCVCV